MNRIQYNKKGIVRCDQVGFITGRHIRKSVNNRLTVSVDQEWKTMHLIDSEMTVDKVQLS